MGAYHWHVLMGLACIHANICVATGKRMAKFNARRVVLDELAAVLVPEVPMEAFDDTYGLSDAAFPVEVEVGGSRCCSNVQL